MIVFRRQSEQRDDSRRRWSKWSRWSRWSRWSISLARWKKTKRCWCVWSKRSRRPNSDGWCFIQGTKGRREECGQWAGPPPPSNDITNTQLGRKVSQPAKRRYFRSSYFCLFIIHLFIYYSVKLPSWTFTTWTNVCLYKAHPHWLLYFIGNIIPTLTLNLCSFGCFALSSFPNHLCRCTLLTLSLNRIPFKPAHYVRA